MRELKNCVQRAFILCDDEVDLQGLGLMARSPASDASCLRFTIGTPLAVMEKKTIFATLDHCSGNKRRAAEILGVSLKTLYNRLSEYQGAGQRVAAL